MNEVLAKGIKAKERLLESLCLNLQKQKNEALSAIADQLILETAYILENKRDIEEGKAKGFSDSLLDRLLLTENRIIDMTEGLSS